MAEPRRFEEPVGKVERYIPKSRLAVVRVERGELHPGDLIRIGDVEDDIFEEIRSLEINHHLAHNASEGTLVGIRVAEPVREDDDVFLVH